MKEYIKHNRYAYDKLSSQYQKRKKHYVDSVKTTVSLFTTYLKEKFDNVKILELGPGSGLSLSYFESEGFNATGIDFSEKMLKVARKTAFKANYIIGDFLTHNFAKSKYTAIFAQAFIHLFPKEDAKKVLKKIFNLLENDGIAHISTTVHNTSNEGILEKDDYLGGIKRFRKKWKEEELLEEIKKVGFVIHDKEYILDPTNNGKKWIIIIALKKN